MNATDPVDEAVRAALTYADPIGRIVVAYSGGLDSTVLLHAVAALVGVRHRLFALHVNHGISRNADAWQRHCESVGAKLGVQVETRRVVVASGASLEAAARRARYGAFAEVLDTEDVLWLAHHLDDQAETVLWRLMRGGGSAALAGMPAARRLGRGQLLRPLLNVARTDIAAWARSHDVRWIDDDSNSDRRHERNFIRHDVLPVLQRRWPDAASRLHHAALRFADEAAALKRTLDVQLDVACVGSGELPLAALSDAHARPLLRRWLERQGVAGVRERVLTEILRQARGAEDRIPQVVVADGISVRRFAQHLHVVADTSIRYDDVQWILGSTLTLPIGQLDSRRVNEIGLCATLSSVEVRPRRGGERLNPAGRDGSRSVKRLLQEAHVPPWRRAAYPLIYVGDRLAAVPGVAVDAAFADTSGDAWRLTPTWADRHIRA